MLLVEVLSRIVHIATVIALVGGSFFTLAVLLPATKVLSSDAHDKLAAEVISRWKWFVHLGITLLLISGFYNYFQAIPAHKGDGLYHGLVGTKILLAFAIFFISAALVGRSAKLQSMRDNRRKWLTILIVFATLIVAISGFLRVRAAQDSQAPSIEAEATAMVLFDQTGVATGSRTQHAAA